LNLLAPGTQTLALALALATQLQILAEGALASALVRGDPALARAARAAAEVLLDAAAGLSSRRKRR
jgi:hypothetical protein